MSYRYTFTPEIVTLLQTIERARTMVGLTFIPPVLAEDLRLRARLRSAHFSTRIEGNRLTLLETEQAILDGRDFPGREQDSREVMRYNAFARLLGLSPRQARDLLQQWLAQGWLEESAAARKSRRYRLSAVYRWTCDRNPQAR